MKKLLSIVLAITMMFVLCSCENKEALAVEEMITALGEITLESGPAIEKARAAYDALSDEDQTWVYNGYELIAAEKQLKDLQDAETAPTEETK